MTAQEKAIELKTTFPSLNIVIVGKWVWVSGDTKPVKESLKTAGLHWVHSKKEWAWKPDTSKFSATRTILHGSLLHRPTNRKRGNPWTTKHCAINARLR